MANANYQLADKITFYPSYPLYAYTNGKFNYDNSAYSSISGMDKETLTSLLTLNPVKKHKFLSGTTGYLRYSLGSILANHNFFMVLNHDFATEGQTLTLEGSETLSPSPVVNDCTATTAWDGWSLVSFDDTHNEMTINFDNDNTDTTIGTILWGKSFTIGQNVDVNQTFSIKHGNKLTKSIGGSTLSTLKYGRSVRWNKLHSWELESAASDVTDPPTPNTLSSYDVQAGAARGGIRSWTVSFSLLQDSKMMPQNAMLSNKGFTQDSNSEYSMAADGTSLSNAQESDDFYNRVIKLCMGSHLPLVVNISESKNPDQWAVVRISDYKITSSTPKFVNYKLTLEEQI